MSPPTRSCYSRYCDAVRWPGHVHAQTVVWCLPHFPCVRRRRTVHEIRRRISLTFQCRIVRNDFACHWVRSGRLRRTIRAGDDLRDRYGGAVLRY